MGYLIEWCKKEGGFLKKNIVLIIVILLSLTGCLGTDANPSDVELEALELSAILLDKEYIIDELKDTIDQYVDENNSLLEVIEIKNKQIEDEQVLKKRLLEGQPQNLSMNTKKDGYIVVDGSHVFLLYEYENPQYNYKYESIYHLDSDKSMNVENDETFSFELFRGSDLLYRVDTINDLVYIVDMKTIHIYNYDGKEIYTQVLKKEYNIIGYITQTMLTKKENELNIDGQVDGGGENTIFNINNTNITYIDSNNNIDDTNITNIDSNNDTIEDPIEDTDSDINGDTLSDTTYTTHFYVLVTTSPEKQNYLKGVYDISNNNGVINIDLIPVPEELTLALNPYFEDGKMFYTLEETGEILEFDLTEF